MKFSMTALGLAIAAGALGISSAASAQYNTPAPAPQGNAAPPADAQPQEQSKIKVSRGASKAIGELQATVKANDTANFAAKVAAAKAVSKTPDDRYAVAALEYQGAVAAKDNSARADALEGLIASGKVPAADLPGMYADLANTYTGLNQAARASATLQRLIAIDPNNASAVVVLANQLKAQGKTAEAVALLRKSIASGGAGGAKPDEKLYKQAVQLAYDAKSPVALELGRSWVSAYPSANSWHNSIAILRNLNSLDEQALLDALRLERAAGALTGEGDFHRYAYLAATKGFPGEAKAVLEEGFAAGKIDRNKAIFRDTLADINPKAAADKAAVSSAAAKGTAAATAKVALANGDLLYGAGDFAKAAEVYRAALGKSGADANLINLHLGAALARAGDKAGATAALNAVTGPNAEIAKFWLVYLATR